MKKTIGPVNTTQSFMVYNAKGFPRGVTVVTFMRPGDAAKARERYDGKVIDGSAYTLFLECFYHGILFAI